MFSPLSVFTQFYPGKWSGNPVALTQVKSLEISVKNRLVCSPQNNSNVTHRLEQELEGKVEVWRRLRHNNLKTVWGYIYQEDSAFLVRASILLRDRISYFSNFRLVQT